MTRRTKPPADDQFCRLDHVIIRASQYASELAQTCKRLGISNAHQLPDHLKKYFGIKPKA